MKDRSAKIPEWAPVVGGTVLSVAVGVLFYLRTDLKTALAAFAGLLGVAIALQLELLVQARRSAAAQYRRESLAADIEAFPWLPSIVRGSLVALQAIRESERSPIAIDLARDELESCLEKLRDLQRGYLRQESWGGGHAEALTEHVRHTIRATSGPLDLPWWRTHKAGYYLQQQLRAIERGVTIERIFIYDTWSDEHEEICIQQQRLGITVLRAEARRVSNVQYPDLILWDDTCGFSVDYNLAGTSAADRFTFLSNEIRSLESIYEIVRAVAHEFTPARTIEPGSRH